MIRTRRFFDYPCSRVDLTYFLPPIPFADLALGWIQPNATNMTVRGDSADPQVLPSRFRRLGGAAQTNKGLSSFAQILLSPRRPVEALEANKYVNQVLQRVDLD